MIRPPYTASETDVVISSDRFFATPAWEPLCEWVRRHGVAPEDVPLDCWIHRDVEHRRVILPVVVRDDAGRMVKDGDGTVAIRIREVQLEAPPLPFPAEVLEGVAS